MSIKDTKMVGWNNEAKTTSRALKYLIYQNIPLNDFLNLKEMKTLNLDNNKIFKISMGSFLKDKKVKHIDPIENFENNNLIVMHENTANKQGYKFKNNLEIGDYVYLTYGMNRLSNLYEITSLSEPVNNKLPLDLEDGWICREVKLVRKPVISNTKDIANVKSPKWVPSAFTTFCEIDNIKEANRILFNKYYNINLTREQVVENRKNKEVYVESPLNQILFGPPGTGKTYHTKKIAIEIIDKKVYPEQPREDILKRYDELLEKSQIQFTTFHQSMSYEDFVEGIKPSTQDDQISYSIIPGIFKQICDLAKIQKESNFEEAYTKLISGIVEKEDDYLVLYTQRNKKYRVNVNTNNNLTLYTSEKVNKHGVLTKENLFKFFNGEEVLKGWEGCATGVINYLKTEYNLSHNTSTPNREKNYVLIIDEINRGNVPAIFGELITLLEKDKREGDGANETIKAILPYSKEPFTVPANLFIIGTMNTADRSVEALDTALRRRFSFKEILPNPDLLKDKNIEGIELKELLLTINRRIELLLDKNHTIGHSYFLNISTLSGLKSAFSDSVIPLLEEYFYGDYGKIGLVLGGAFVETEKMDEKIKFANNFAYDDKDILRDKPIYRFTNSDTWRKEAFSSVYDNNSPSNEK